MRVHKARDVGKTTVPNLLTQILKTVCKKYAETWQRPLKHPGLAMLAPTGKERKTNRDIFGKLKNYNLFH